jgi:hypothetical protein
MRYLDVSSSKSGFFGVTDAGGVNLHLSIRGIFTHFYPVQHDCIFINIRCRVIVSLSIVAQVTEAVAKDRVAHGAAAKTFRSVSSCMSFAKPHESPRS